MHLRVAAAGSLVCAALLVLASACSSFESTPDQPSSPDAVATDGSTNDTSPVTDSAASDAGIDVHLTCPPGAFCDDFERTTMPEIGWSTYLTTGGTLTIVPDPRPRGGSVLEVALPADTNDGRLASLTYRFPTPRPKARLAFDFMAKQGPDNDFLLAQLDMTEGNVFVILRDSKLSLNEQSTAPDSGKGNEATLQSILSSDFHHVVLTFTPTIPPQLTLAVDQLTPIAIDVASAVGPINGAAVGSTYARKGGAAKVLFDDVVIETTF